VNDPAGKIRQISSKLDNAPSPEILYNILYNSNSPNEIIVAVPAIVTNGNEITDTTHLFLDGNNRVTKRIRLAFETYYAPQNLPKRTYTFDTTTYEYDGAGLLIKETRGGIDSTWFNPGTVETTNTRTTGESTYTNTNGDLKLVISLTHTTTITRAGSNTFIDIHGSKGNLSFQYVQLYPNKTDFKNAAVLNQLELFGDLPMNKNYQHLPSYSQLVYQELDQFGATISGHTTATSNQFTHNYYGFVETKMDPASPDAKVTFVYSQ
jgi:YD repeat-containing protein